MEIAYAENAWHVISAFAIFCVGFLAFAVHPFRAVPGRLSIALYLWHSLFCLYYARFALYNTADARGYFVRSFNDDLVFIPGTRAVEFITSIFTQFIGLSYLGTFLVYNIVGAIGLLAIAASIREVLVGKSARHKLFASLITFAPGINFWSVAIGKDAPALMGTGLLCWAALNPRRRWIALLVGIAAYGIVRPHIAAVILVALLLATVITGHVSLAKKVLILLVLAVPSAFAVQIALNTIGLGSSGAFRDAAEFIEYRQSINTQGGASVDISGMILPEQMFYYAFMPMFLGAGGLMGLVASIENAFLLFLVGISAMSLFKRHSCLAPTVKWFYLLFSLMLWIIFAMTTANLGIALRQKWMFMPMLLIFCLSYLPEWHSIPAKPKRLPARPRPAMET